MLNIMATSATIYRCQ